MFRFSPALQPVHAKELIHMLAHIKAVQINKMTKAKKPGMIFLYQVAENKNIFFYT